MTDRRLSWDWGPAESRFVRTLFYLAVGISGGVLLALSVSVLPHFVAELADGVERWTLGLLAVFAVAVAPKLWAAVAVRRAHRDQSRLANEWAEVGLAWGVAAALLVGGLLVWAETAFELGLVQHPRAFVSAGLLVSATLAAVAGFLGSVGEIDPDALTLSYGDRDRVDLRYLTDVKCLGVGRYTALWLLFDSRPGNRRSGQDVYAMPTEVVERARPVFEAGIAADPDDATEKSRLLRRVNVGVAVGAVGLAVGVLAVLAWVASPPGVVLQWLWLTAGLGVFFLRLLVRTV